MAWLGRKSRLTELMKSIRDISADRRAAFGQHLNAVKASLEAELSARRETLTAAATRDAVDVTLPGGAVPQGRLHPITRTISTILALFVPMGFEIVEGPEIESERNNFDALNIPRDHPSRESFDTFFPEKLAVADSIIEGAEAIGREYDIAVDTQVKQARSAGQAIVELIRNEGFDLVFLGAHPRALSVAPGRTTFGTTVEHVVKNAPCRVWIFTGKSTTLV